MWKAVCCEIQGRGHIKTETPCQDKTKQLLQNNVNVIALADGAGSAKLSHYGAECVVENISAYIADNFLQLIENADGKQVKLDIMNELKLALNNKAIELNCKVNDLASTLLLVAVFEDLYIIVHIGDGVIGYLDDTELKIASSPDNGEFANVTTFVTSSEALPSMRLFKGNINNISGFVIMSDGTEHSLYHKPTKTLAKSTIKLMHRTCLTNSKVMRSQLVEMLSTVISKNTQDDCSIAILARPFGKLRPLEDMSFDERRELFRISYKDKQLDKRVTRYDYIVELLMTEMTLKQVARDIHLKPKYAKRHLDRLVNVGLISKCGTLYSRCMK
jgi:hypothetical protein